MLHRILGASGSGKTEYIFDRLGEALKKGRQCILLVPEQQSVAYESALCERFGDSVNLLCEVLNFERLPNRVARDFGGLAVNNIDKGGACALLSLVAESLKDELKEYSAVASDTDFAISLYSLISRMKMALITPRMIIDAAESGSIASDDRVKAKLRDIGIIYSEYENRFSEDMRDPRDALTRLSAELPQKPFFQNACVFIDSYYTFTEQEYSIIKEIISRSRDTYISFTVDYNRSFFEENKKAADRVLALAGHISDDHYTNEPGRSNSRLLKYIERNLWKSNVKPINGDDGAVKMITAKNRFEEAEAVAAEVLDFVRAGGRFRDITILAGNAESYAPIIDSVFSRAEIPVYMSKKEDISTKQLFSFLLASISVVTEDFSLRSIKRYIKSGYTSLTVSQSDALLSYASAWNLRGKAWYNGEEWTLDPEGYREGDLTSRGARLLKSANKARDIIVAPLAALRDSLADKNLTVSSALRAIYHHLMAMGADEKLRKNAERLLKKGEREDSERELQQWKLLINIIDQLDSVCGDMHITPKRLASLIRLMCDCYSLGAIPASADAVTFGDAALIRAGGSKMTAVMGVCDGEFPAMTQNSSFFDRNEAVLLEEAGLILADTLDKQLNTNRFFVYAAFASPTEKLVLTVPRSELGGGDLRPSTAWLGVEKMLSEVKPVEFDSDTQLYSRESVAANFPSLAAGRLRDDIAQSLSSANVPFFCEYPDVCDKSSQIDFTETSLNLSPSKFETYANCPFSFFGNYLLGLKPKRINEFSMPEIGNFVHKMLDHFMRQCMCEGRFIAPDGEKRENIINDLSETYLREVIGINALSDKRFMHTYSNMVRTVKFVAESLCNEFSKSDFVPTGFEFKIGLKDEDIPAIEYDLGGKRVFLRGSIDRVDSYVHGGEKYARVIDYKTYGKDFSVKKVPYGLDSQLLHYLYAYCEKTDSKPAGVFYYTVTLPNVAVNGREPPEKLAKEMEKTLKRSGILLDSPEIVRAMSNDFSFVPAKLNKQGALYTRGKSKRLFSDEDFTELGEVLREQIKTLAGNVFCGKMDISPLEIENLKTEPCKYCALGDICRNGKQEEEDEDDDSED